MKHATSFLIHNLGSVIEKLDTPDKPFSKGKKFHPVPQILLQISKLVLLRIIFNIYSWQSFIYTPYFFIFSNIFRKSNSFESLLNFKETSVSKSICYLRYRFLWFTKYRNCHSLWFHFLKKLFVQNTSMSLDSCFQIFHINERNLTKSSTPF